MKTQNYEMNLRFSALKSGKTLKEKAVNLNLLEDILDTSRSIDDIVKSVLNGTTPKVYKVK